jgi:hypothetical protein
MARLAMVAAGMQLGPPAIADVCDLVQRGLAARARGDNDASIYYLGQAIGTGTLAFEQSRGGSCKPRRGIGQ